MGITITKDETDNRVDGMREKRKEIARRGGMPAVRELDARTIELDRTAIHNPDPHYAYRLANKDHKGRVGILKGLGYEIVPPKDEAQLVTGVEQEGAQTHGDLILMRTPIENYEKRRANRRARYEMQTGAYMDGVRDKIEKDSRDQGVKVVTFDESSDK